MKPIHIVANDRIGLLADIAYLMAQARINIEGLCVQSCEGMAYLMLEVSDPIHASELLSSNHFDIVPEGEMSVHPRGLVRELAIVARGDGPAGRPGGDGS
jgi:hypothetical protein